VAFLYERRNGLSKDSPIRARAGNLNSVAGKTQPFTAEEISRMLVASESQERRRGAAPLRPILLTFLYTGLRISDLCALRWSSLQGGWRDHDQAEEDG